MPTSNFFDTTYGYKMYEFAPGQSNIPLSMLKDKFCEELAFPSVFMGEKHPTNKIKVHCSTIMKSELRNCDKRVTENIENIFFNYYKLQLKHLIDKVNISVRKMKLGSERNLNAGYFKNEESISRLITEDKAYKFMTSLRGLPPYFEKVPKELMANIHQLGPAIFFMTYLQQKLDGHIF